MNLASIIEAHPADAIALISAGERTTYGALREQVARVRAGLPIEPGDRVALVLSANWYFVVSYLAVVGAGGIAVPLNPQSPSPELERELALVQPKVAVVGPTGEAAFSGVDRRVAGIEKVFVPEGVTLTSTSPFEDLLVFDPMPIVDRAANHPAVLLFTSGTAGAPKAATLTHGCLSANLEQMQSSPGLEMRPSDVCLSVLPLFHVFGLNAVLGRALHAGAASVLVQRFEPASALATIVERGVTVVAGVPPMYRAWVGLEPSEASAADLAGVRAFTSGAAKLDAGVAAAFQARFGKRIREGYGLTETSPVVTAALDESPDGSIGPPLVGVAVRVVDDRSDDCAAGDPGEIWVRGPNVFAGYWNDPDASAAVLTPDGWLRTGDIAVVDDQGNLTIVDRAKDLIIVSGFNVYPAEVEEVLLEHAGVAEAAVVGVPHPQSGETVRAYVVAEPDRLLDEDEVIAFCRRRLARYKCPSKVLFVNEVPRGISGKVLRRELTG